MTTGEIELASLFKTVTKALKGNQEALNEADSYNHNHGDNMVKNFKVITKALEQKSDASPTEQLAYASKVLQNRSPSGSAQMYAEGLEKAAETVRGQPAITPENALGLVQALMGGGQPSQPAQQTNEALSGDMMGSLIGSLLGGGMGSAAQPQTGNQQSGDMGDLLGSLLGGAMTTQSHQENESQPSGDMGDLLGSLLGSAMGSPTQGQSSSQPGGDLGDILGSLLGGQMQAPSTPSQQTQHPSEDTMGSLLGSLLGGSSSSSGTQSGGGLDIGTLMTMGMAYLQAKQQGASPMEAILQVIMSGSQMNNTAYHSQSGQLVAGTLLNTIGSVLSSK